MDWADLYDADQDDSPDLDQELFDAALAPLARELNANPHLVRMDEIVEETGVPLS